MHPESQRDHQEALCRYIARRFLFCAFAWFNSDGNLFFMVAFFDKIIGVLDQNHIPYMLSGSVAMSLYIVPRATRDLDFIIHLKAQDVDSFVDHFKQGYYCDKDSIIEAIKYSRMFNIIDHQSGFKADFVILKEEPFRQEEFNRRRKFNSFGIDVFVVSPEDLLISKLIWIQELQSSIQKEDINKLAQISTLDWVYIDDWVKKLELNTFDLF